MEMGNKGTQKEGKYNQNSIHGIYHDERKSIKKEKRSIDVSVTLYESFLSRSDKQHLM
jgi:hypothetical protein